ncbi:MAG: hypothetical protein K0S07_432 [Chlamydiales bacterium]|nr:hypothetical protein [Chlamydiales bacterium]
MSQKWLLSFLCVCSSLGVAQEQPLPMLKELSSLEQQQREVGFRLVDIAKKKLKRKERVEINLGGGYSQLVARLSDDRLVVIASGPYPSSKEDRQLRRIAMRKSKEVQLILGDKKEKGGRALPSDLFIYSPYALYLARDLLSPAELKELSSFSLYQTNYYLDFHLMEQIRSDRPYVRKPFHFTENSSN